MTTKEEKSKTEENLKIQGQTKAEEKSTTFDIKVMSNLLEDKTLLGTPLEAHIETFTFKKYNIINPSSKSKRIDKDSTIRYYCQAYLYDENSKKFYILEKTYKNIKKDKISKMSLDKKWIRYCLLLMMEGEQSLFEINKEINKELLSDFYQEQVNLFFKLKKKDKENELMEIEKEKINEQNLKEKEELKKRENFKKESFLQKILSHLDQKRK